MYMYMCDYDSAVTKVDHQTAKFSGYPVINFSNPASQVYSSRNASDEPTTFISIVKLLGPSLSLHNWIHSYIHR